MNEDELLMAIATLHRDISDNRKTASKAEFRVAEVERRIARQELIYTSTRSALEHLIKQPVIMMAEFRSLRSGLQVSRKALAELREERKNALEIEMKARRALPALERSLGELEQQLAVYEPPRTVLEFRRRE